MKNSRWFRAMFAFAAIVIAVLACSGPAPLPTPTTFPTPRLVYIPTPETPTPQVDTPVLRPGTTKVNLDEIAPPGRERDLLIMNCGNCHSFVCALRGQRTDAHWELVKLFHQERHWVVLPDQEYDLLFSYLKANFNESKPVPILPPALEDQGCTTPALR